MISIRGLTITAAGRPILHNVSIESKTRVLHIRGSVGSGKTLLARALCGDFSDSEVFRVTGEVNFCGYQFTLPRPPNSDKRVRSAFLPQHSSNFFLTGTVGSEVFLSALGGAQTEKETETRYADWLRDSPLSAFVKRSPLALSGGQQRLLMLEAALVSQPKHLVVDGGMEGFDAQFKQRQRFLIDRWLAEEGDRVLIYLSLPHAPDLASGGEAFSLSESGQVPTPEDSKPEATISPLLTTLAYKKVSARSPRARNILFRDVNFALREGEFVGLRGANGVGKSTMLRLVAGVVPLRSGRIEFKGSNIRRMRWPGIVHGVAYLPQEPDLAGPTLLGGTDFERVPVAPGNLAEKCESSLRGTWEDYWTMSAGQRAIASLMIQLDLAPDCWLLDEPTSFLEGRLVVNLISRARRENPKLCGLVVSHDSALLEKIADRQVELTEGGIKKVHPM